MVGPVRLPGRAGVHTLDVVDGRIAAITEQDETAAPLALPPLVDLHVHADRAFALGPRPARSLADAIDLVSAIKREATVEAVADRAQRLFERALAHGTSRIRTHVDVDHLVDDRALLGVRTARAALAGRLEIELVAFATAWTDPATADGRRRLEDALENGAELLGAVPAFHQDPARSLEALLDLAAATGARIDVHLDEHLDGDRFQLEQLADGVLGRGLEGRVTASHCCALAAVDDATARRTIEKVSEAGITVVALPALNLFLADRAAMTPRMRGITLVRELVAQGVAVRFGSDNVRDVFYPYGDADLLEAGWLASLAAHVDDEDVLLAGVCDGRTRLEIDDPADHVLVAADSLSDALARRPGNRSVVHAREVASESTT
ncbi:MAG: amidohydrolase family protein [Gaiellales bacterium]